MGNETALSSGMVVGETYEVERLLGRGGMGEVWAAKHRRLPGKFVAIKVLHTSGAALTAEALARFRREAEIAGRLAHPNIVEVQDFNTLPSGQPYLVMELLRGESVAQRLQRGPFTPDEVRRVVRQVGSALKAAHDVGVVHRDLKPDNLFLTPTDMGDALKVLDFGISKLADSRTVQTTESTLIGTPLYMSPEQALGNNKDITAQSDVFSLGSICYELLTGQPAFAADNVAKVIFRIAYEPHVPLKAVRPDVPDDLAAAIEGALVKDKAKRTPDIRVFVQQVTGQALAETLPEGASSAPREVSALADTGGFGATAVSQKHLQPASEVATPKLEGARAPSSSPVVPAGAAAPKSSLVAKLWPVALGLGVAGAALVWRGVGGGAARVEVDAGAVPVVRAKEPPPEPVVVDASVAVAVADVDAGEPAPGPVVDAGRPADTVRAAPVEAPLPPADVPVLAEIEARRAKGEWKMLADSRLGYESRLTSARAKREALVVFAEAACHQRLPMATTLLNRLEGEFGMAARRKAVERCRKAWPERDW